MSRTTRRFNASKLANCLVPLLLGLLLLALLATLVIVGLSIAGISPSF
jgi:hypothetical protein